MRFCTAFGWGAGFALVLVIVVYVVLLGCGWRFCFVKSGSMAPEINVGDLVAFCAGDAVVGEVVVYDDGEKLIAHRVLSVGTGSLTVGGDSAYSTATDIDLGAVCGRVVYHSSLDRLLIFVLAGAILCGILTGGLARFVGRSATLGDVASTK